MARDIVLDIIANDDVSRTLARTARAFDELAEDLDHVSKRGGQFSDDMTRTRVTVEHLDNVITKTKGNVRNLAEEFARTGDMDVFAKMRDGERIVRDLERIKRAIGDLPEPKSFTKDMGAALDALGPELGTIVKVALVAAAVSAAPMMAGALNAAILGGLGTAGLAVGIAAAAKSQEVVSAFQSLSDEAGAQFDRIGMRFKLPVVDALDVLTKGLKSIDFDSVLAPLADEVKPLAEGLVGLVHQALPGIREAVAASAPIIDALASKMPDIGNAIGSFARHLADAGPAAKEVLLDVITLGTEGVRTIGWLVEFFAKLYHGAKEFTPVGLALRGILELGDSGGQMVSVTYKLADANERAAAAARNSAEAFDQARQKLDAYYQAQRGTFDASIALEQGIDDLKAAVDEHGRSLDITTQKGRDNVQIIERMVDAAIREGTETENAAKAQGREATAYSEGMAARNAAIAKIMQVGQSYGWTADQVQNVIDKVLGLPQGTRVMDYKVNITANVYGAAGALNAVLNPGSVTAAQLNNSRRLLDKGRALGGDVKRGQAYIVGERRPELFVPTQDGVIMPSVPTAADLVAAFAGTGSDGGVTVNVSAGMIISESDLEAVLAAALRRYVKSNGPMPELVG